MIFQDLTPTARIESGELFEFSPLLPLLKMKADPGTLAEVKSLIELEPDSKRRSDLYSLAVTISGRYLEKDILWNHFKEELQMIRESEVVQEWIDEGIQKGMQQGVEQGVKQGAVQNAREAVLSALEVRFDLVPMAIIKLVNEMDDPFQLKVLHKKAVTIPSLDEFKKVLYAMRE